MRFCQPTRVLLMLFQHGTEASGTLGMHAAANREQLDRGTLLEALDFHSYYTASIKLSLAEKR